jgi:hypothetical protein
LGWLVHATMPSFFSTEMGSCQLFCSGGPESPILLISVSQVSWDDRCVPLCPTIGWDIIWKTPCLGWPGTVILPISAS